MRKSIREFPAAVLHALAWIAAVVLVACLAVAALLLVRQSSIAGLVRASAEARL